MAVDGEPSITKNEQRLGPSDSFEDFETAWIEEQHRIASKVIVPGETCFSGKRIRIDDRFTLVQSKILQARLGLTDSLASSIAGEELPISRERLFGGLDITYDPQDENVAIAVYVIIDSTTLQVIYQDIYFHRDEETSRVPYIPSFLAYRELPHMLRLVEKQVSQSPHLTPSALLVDGNGVLHPRRAGLACFVGVKTGIPTIGVAKSLFCFNGFGRNELHRSLNEAVSMACRSLNQAALGLNCDKSYVLFQRNGIGEGGSTLCDQQEDRRQSRNETIKYLALDDSKCPTKDERKLSVVMLATICAGMAVPLDIGPRPRHSVTRVHEAFCVLAHGNPTNESNRSSRSTGSNRPLFVSVGHDISPEDSVLLSIALAKFRVPEPIRQADLIGRHFLRTLSLNKNQVSRHLSNTIC